MPYIVIFNPIIGIILPFVASFFIFITRRCRR